MYIISILAVIIMSKFFTEGSSGIFFPLNPYPLTLILLFSFSLLTGTGLLKDFNNAFRISLWKKNRGESVNELKRAIEAVSLVKKISLMAGVFLFFFEACQILTTLDLSSLSEPLGIMIVNGLIGPLYSATIILILLPMESMLKLKLWNAQKSQEILKEREIFSTLKPSALQNTLDEQNTSADINMQDVQNIKEE